MFAVGAGLVLGAGAFYAYEALNDASPPPAARPPRPSSTPSGRARATATAPPVRAGPRYGPFAMWQDGRAAAQAGGKGWRGTTLVLAWVPSKKAYRMALFRDGVDYVGGFRADDARLAATVRDTLARHPMARVSEARARRLLPDFGLAPPFV
jgi:hypothetical protein